MLAEVGSALDRVPLEVEKAKTTFQEGEKLLTDRQKLLKIAERSELGWTTVEYQEDELTYNSDDEKRLFCAEQRAGRKIKTIRMRRGGAAGAVKRYTNHYFGKNVCWISRA